MVHLILYIFFWVFLKASHTPYYLEPSPIPHSDTTVLHLLQSHPMNQQEIRYHDFVDFAR